MKEKDMNNINNDLIDNPTMRVPVCLCLDTSSSMSEPEEGTTRIDALNEGIRLFYDAVREDEVARFSVDIAIVKFDSSAECVSSFSGVGEGYPATLEADGWTSMGEGVNLALDLLDKRKQEYKSTGVDYYQPWLVLMTDGEPNGDEHELKRAMERCTLLANNRKLSVFPILIGRKVSSGTLAGFSPRRSPISLKGVKFKEFFEWLSKSVQAVSRSVPGENIPSPSVRGWAEI